MSVMGVVGALIRSGGDDPIAMAPVTGDGSVGHRSAVGGMERSRRRSPWLSWDMRMVLVASATWAVSLCTHLVGSLISQRWPVGAWTGTLIWVSTAVALAVSGILVMSILHARPFLAPTVALVVVVVMLSALTTLMQDVDRALSAGALLSPGRSRIDPVRMTFTGLVEVSSSRGADCQVAVMVRGAGSSSTYRRMALPALAFGDDEACERMVSGATVDAVVDARASPLGGDEPWLTMENADSIVVIAEPSGFARWKAALYDDFFGVCQRLSDQGRMLVPGLSLGLLGAERYDADDQGALDLAYVDYVREGFSHAGIMHLMAVSGGHFILITGAIHGVCRRVRSPRWLTGLISAVGCAVLAAVMAPSDSVARALIMGVWSSGWMVLGRRPRSLVALSWTVIISIIVDPSMSRSYGFSLSCAAVLGIVLFADGWRERLASVMGKSISAALSMTLAAQMATAPIQVLLEPEIPLMAPIANLIVAPIVGVSTIAGLMAFALSPVLPLLAYWCAVAASWGTAVMEAAATSSLSVPHSILPWFPSPWGSAALVLTYVVVAVMAAAWRGRAARRRAMSGPGRAFHRSPLSRLRRWTTETKNIVERLW